MRLGSKLAQWFPTVSRFRKRLVIWFFESLLTAVLAPGSWILINCFRQSCSLTLRDLYLLLLIVPLVILYGALMNGYLAVTFIARVAIRHRCWWLQPLIPLILFGLLCVYRGELSVSASLEGGFSVVIANVAGSLLLKRWERRD